VRKKSNREIVAWAGGGVVALAIGFWAVFTYAFPGKSSAAVEANCGAVAIGGNVSGSTVTAGRPTAADCSRKK
jgi:hypothetical protein